jgi:hypothetical protein
MGVISASNQNPSKNMDHSGSQIDKFTEKYKDISNHPYANEIRTLFDIGFANLYVNERAIDKFSGNLELAINYLFQSQEEINEINPGMIKRRDFINAKIETP